MPCPVPCRHGDFRNGDFFLISKSTLTGPVCFSHVFSPSSAWFSHLRLDSSPQFAKNYLVGELDKISFHDGDMSLSNIHIEIRLLPLQVLGKLATNTAYKTKACCRMLDLECDPAVARIRLRSLTTDFGVESGLWAVPRFDEPEEKFFPHILPIADLDHGMHHCMKETASAYDSDSWAVYEKQLAGISKLFARRETVDRFVAFHIWNHHGIPQAAKKSLAAMFDVTCPSLCQHRWQYNFEVLRWVCKRQAFFQYLEPSIVAQNHADTDMSKDEMSALTSMLEDPHVHARFWAFAWCEFLIHSWGFSVSRWLHGCPCHSSIDCVYGGTADSEKPCVWNGRRLIQVAEGKLNVFHNDLLALRIESSEFAAASLEKLASLDLPASLSLQTFFQTAKKRVALRFKQAFSYLTEFPWNLPKLLGFMCPQPDGVSHQDKIAESKAFAAELVRMFDSGSLASCGTFWRFLAHSESLGQSLRRWASEDVSRHLPMDADLFQELVGYAASQLCMQRLESRHHLINQRMTVARASSPGTLSANLRRILNADSRVPLFRDLFASYLLEFDKLVAYPWKSRAELVKIVAGYHSELMFTNLDAEQKLVSLQAVQNRSSREYNEQLNHLKSVLDEGSYYAVLQSKAPRSFLILQVVSLQPAAKRYMQRVFKWSPDP